jgi:tetratricopeptide (TPR) repeat protein
MKNIYLSIILLLLCLNGFSQKAEQLAFDTDFYDAIDQYVAFTKTLVNTETEDNKAYTYGFIYIDQIGGIVLRCTGEFELRNDAIFAETIIADPTDIHPLNKKGVKFHVLSDEHKKQLGLSERPKWLQTEASATNKAIYYKNRGLFLNAVGASDNAITPLLKAYKIDRHLEGLPYELAYAYNSLGKYKEAIEIATESIKNNPYRIEIHRELGYAHQNSNNPKLSEEAYLTALKISKNDDEKSGIALKMTEIYFKEKDQKKFNEWADKTLEFSNSKPNYVKIIDALRRDF